MIRKKQRKMFDQQRARSQSEDLYDTLDLEQEMKCKQTLEQLNYFGSNLQSNYREVSEDKHSFRCSKCEGFITGRQDFDADLKKRLKRRQYKKRQKVKAQQKKQQALKDLSVIIGEIYLLKTNYEQERGKIEQCLKAIQKNVNRFYEFINAVIRQQVETIKKQMRICLSQLATIQPNLAKVPRLYEQFIKVKGASLEVEKIINAFIDIISQQSQESTKYQKDLDKKTFRFLLNSDTQNRNAFLEVKKILEQGYIKHEREKQMLRKIVQIANQKNISSCSSSDQGSEGEQSNTEEEYYEETEAVGENTTKASEQQEEDTECFNEGGGQSQNQKENKPIDKEVKQRKKHMRLKIYEATFEKTYDTLIQLQKTLGCKKEDRLPCNLEEEWMAKLRQKYLKIKQ